MKKIIIIFASTVVLVIGLYLANYSTNENILKSNNINVSKDKAIAIMISNPTGDGYYESSSDTFPTGLSLNTTLSSCENGGTISYDGTNVTVEVNRSDKCYVYFDAPTNYLTDKIRSNYTNDDVNFLHYHDGEGAYATYEAGDFSYRYNGPSADVQNYVCFASDEETCPTDNLYRIIGLFKNSNNKYQAKLIKASAANSTLLGTNGAYSSSTEYYWTSASNKSNVWGGSELNTINLNTNYVAYLNNINTKWMNMVDTHTWKVGGNTSTYIMSTKGAQNVYAKEITSPATGDTYNDEIGLMYVSDYMYGASPTYWNLQGYNSSDDTKDYRAAISANWLYLGSNEWLITRQSDNSSNAFYVYSSGLVYNNSVGNKSCAVRPVFYLNSDVTYAGGTGTSGDPYRISS